MASSSNNSSSARAPADVAPLRRRRKAKHTIYHLDALNADHDPYASVHSGSGAAESHEDYKLRSASSDYYKRQFYKEVLEFERNRAKLHEQKVEGYSPGYYIVMFLLTSAIIVLLVSYISNASQIQGETLRRPTPKALMSKNKAFTVMSESLDCSLYMKRLSISDADLGLHGIVRQGIMCLTLLVPYSAAGVYSAFSLFSLFRRTPEGMIENEIASSNNYEEPGKYLQYFINYCYIVQVSLPDVFANPSNESIFLWFEGSNESQHKNIWRRGVAENAPDSRKWTRSFRIPHQLVDHLRRANRTNSARVQAWLDHFELRNEMDLTKQRIFATQNTPEQLQLFEEKGAYEDTMNSYGRYSIMGYPVYVHVDPFRNDSIYFPKRDGRPVNTFSLFSAFVISTVTKVFEYAGATIPASDRELFFLYSFLRAQEAAFSFLHMTRDFNPHPAGNPRSRVPNRTLYDYHVKIAEMIYRKEFISPPVITTRFINRVTSLALWSVNLFQDWPITFTMSRPDPFEVHPRMTQGSGDYTYFFYAANNNRRYASTYFVPAAEVVIARGGIFTGKVTHVITASGSIRTIEAVAMTALRMLLFDDSVDNAVTAKSGFYDLQRRKFYCEDKKMIKRLFKKYGFVCHEIPVDYFEANDRVVMAAHMPEAESDLRRYIHAAMDSRIKYRDHNYVVGY